MKTLVSLVGLLLLSVFVLPGAARAESCTFNVSPLNFGTVNLLSGAAVDGTATISISCTNTLNVSLAARLCLNLDTGSGGMSGGARAMTGGGNALQYQFYKDAQRQVLWGHTDAPSLGAPTAIDMVLLPLTTVTTSRTIYARILSNQSTARGGTYISTFSGAQVRFNLASYTLSPPDCSSVLQNASSPTFTVQANVDRVCNVTAQDLNFGSHGLLGVQVDASTMLRVNCTVGLSYAVGLGGGIGNLSPTTRRMTNGMQSVAYGLFRNAARSQVWGDATGLLGGGTGTGLAQDIPIYGRVPAQTTPSPGTYRDTVIVTVTY